MSLKEQLKEDLKTAMRNKDVCKRDSIRAINTMIKQIEVDERKDLNGKCRYKTKRINFLQSLKLHQRDDLVEQEQTQINVFMLYLPTQTSDEELEAGMKEIIAQVEATSMKDIGKVIWEMQQKFAGVADGKKN